MANRVKVAINIPTVSSLEEASVLLSEIADRQRTLTLIKTGMNEDIAKLKLTAAADSAPILLEVEVMEQALAIFGEKNRDVLFAKAKTASLPFGEMGFRASTKAMLLSKAWTWERVLAAVKDKGLHDCVRVKEEVDKDALRALPPEKLKEVGVKLKQEDAFFYTIKEEELHKGVSL